jgi:hypothetical protein
MIWAEAELRETIVKAWSYHGKRRPWPSALTGPQAVRQCRGEGTALSGVSVVIAQNAAEALPTMHRTAPASDLACWSRKPRWPAGSTQQAPVVMYANEPTRRGCSDGAIRRPRGRPLPGWRAAVARAGGRSSSRTRCGCGDKHSFGPRRRAVKRLNGGWPRSRKPRPQGQLQLG